jgi:6-phosphogluconolactonase
MKPARGRLIVFDNAEALARGVANWLSGEALRAKGWFDLCLSGGSTPKRLYEIMATPPVLNRFPWALTRFTFGDERFVPPDDPASNAHMAQQAMFLHVPVRPFQVHAMPTVGLTPLQAAVRYQRNLQCLYGQDELVPQKTLFDVILLGVGDDGHTASLIPGQDVVEERRKWVGVVSKGRPETRLTLTFPAIESSAKVAFLLQGEGKQAILDRLLSGDDSVPAGQVRPVGEIFWFADRAAAGRWSETGV